MVRFVAPRYFICFSFTKNTQRSWFQELPSPNATSTFRRPVVVVNHPGHPVSRGFTGRVERLPGNACQHTPHHHVHALQHWGLHNQGQHSNRGDRLPTLNEHPTNVPTSELDPLWWIVLLCEFKSGKCNPPIPDTLRISKLVQKR
jgi:hypothetical protein